MTPSEYIQLKAFARVDGLMLALLWVASFGCYIAGFSNPSWSLVAMLLAVSTPVVAFVRLRNYRDYGREGFISLSRAWVFVILMFFYAAILFALAQYVYFAYMDNGYFVTAMTKMMSTPEAAQMMKQYEGMTEAVGEGLQSLRAMRPIDLALQVLSTNIMIGIVVGFPIALFGKRSVVKAS